MAEAQDRKEYLVGVDLGGTKILAGVFRSPQNCVGRTKMSTKSQRGVKAIIDRVARCVQDAVDECDLSLKQVRAVGVGAPGAVDPESGRVILAPNLGWENVPLQRELEDHLELPVVIENDCNAATMGIYATELEAKPRSMVGIYLGTGVGGGLILDKKLYSGFNRTAGEIGHMVLEVEGPKCNCGNRGCLEALASRTAIFRRVQTAVKEGQKTVLTSMLGDDLADMRSGDLRKAIRQGDRFVERVIEEAAEYTGIAVANLINLLNPEVIVLGGGVIAALEDEMMSIIVETARDYAFAGSAKGVEIVASKLGDDAGIVGGAVLARDRTR
ncbi:MAG TPA: ROK family protein [Candidatus Paceibacterota bacterium]|nr:ROK family protein [Verrucomicrobiota bacterium]HOX02880.1 ROK family protein [Verrucomicrobiota bacterium]HRZ45632.1 ROK family protein [Candidatus Paceibacterota bacterium]HRZ93172.1 ROK family protein [Candidatus Paceibacterota bacterium]